MSGSNWYNFSNSTTASATEVNENFAWSQGDLMPHSNGTLVDGQFNVGTTTARWNRGSFRQIDLHGNAIKAWNYLGAGSLGAFVSSTTTELAGEYEYTNFTLAHTLTVGTGGRLIIRVNGTLTLNDGWEVNGIGAGGAGGAGGTSPSTTADGTDGYMSLISGRGVGGGGAGGGGGGASASTTAISGVDANDYGKWADGGIASVTSGGQGAPIVGVGESYYTDIDYLKTYSIPLVGNGGSGGGAGGGGSVGLGGAGGAGGGGGAGIIFVCNQLAVNTTGSFLVDGAAGEAGENGLGLGNGSAGGGGGGGGAGGTGLFGYATITVGTITSITMTALGGLGGTGGAGDPAAYIGGNGGDGNSGTAGYTELTKFA